jgi:hypothetical protein
MSDVEDASPVFNEGELFEEELLDFSHERIVIPELDRRKVKLNRLAKWRSIWSKRRHCHS